MQHTGLDAQDTIVLREEELTRAKHRARNHERKFLGQAQRPLRVRRSGSQKKTMKEIQRRASRRLGQMKADYWLMFPCTSSVRDNSIQEFVSELIDKVAKEEFQRFSGKDEYWFLPSPGRRSAFPSYVMSSLVDEFEARCDGYLHNSEDCEWCFWIEWGYEAYYEREEGYWYDYLRRLDYNFPFECPDDEIDDATLDLYPQFMSWAHFYGSAEDGSSWWNEPIEKVEHQV